MPDPVIRSTLLIDDQTQGGFDSAADRAEKLDARMEELIGTMGDLAEVFRATGEQTEKAAEQAKGFTLAITPTDILNTVKAMTDFVQGVFDLTNMLADANARTGITVETLNGLRLALKGSGQEFAAIEPSLNQWPKRMADVARGTGEAKVAFDALGVKATDSAGKLRDSDVVFREMIESIQGVENPAERSALATAAFGESGTKLLQALGNTGNLEKFNAFAQAFGADIGPQAQASAAEWQRSMANLETVIEGVQQKMTGAFGSDFLDGLTASVIFASELMGGVIDSLLDSIFKLSRAVKALFERDFKRAGEEAKKAFASVTDGAEEAFDAAIKATGEFVRLRGGVSADATGGAAGGGGGGAPAFRPPDTSTGPSRGALASEATSTRDALRALYTASTDLERVFGFTFDELKSLPWQEQQAILTDLNRTLKEEEDARKKLADQAKKEADEAAKAAERRQEQRGAAGAGAISGALTGSFSAALGPLLSSLGPQGAIVGAIVGLLEQGPEAVEQIVKGLGESFATIAETAFGLISDLPKLIPDFLVDVISAIPELMIVGLIQQGPFLAVLVAKGILLGLPDIIAAFVDAFVELFKLVPELIVEFLELPKVLADALLGIKPALKEAFSEAGPAIRKELKNAATDFRKALRQDLKALLKTLKPFGGKDSGIGGKLSEFTPALDLFIDGRSLKQSLNVIGSSRRGGVA